ncbi:Appr-1-p processing protein [Arsukibacterium sp. MJ3]|uniref:macro domain-containing protein n=1 Tax=Arsukibacterium sp. MJ3 TaxID=1632859 RepID=UPI00062727DC|nr:macro domain-containing protein [Arsukibacterium sp. MJ3]KKO47664.1 Appr-1-p processing protein [Arsukibacterium sp. MJ3]
MPISVFNDNIFTSKAQTLVNTVNCEGIMGAGIALECRLRYPDMFNRYQQFCEQKQLYPGKLWLYKGDDRWILNFPTKLQWKLPSKLQYLELGFTNLLQTYQQRGITSIALPLLGADRGGLDKQQVLALMQQRLAPLAEHITVEIYLYRPDAKDDLFNQFAHQLGRLNAAQLKDQTGISTQRLETLQHAVVSGRYAQINQLVELPGIGLKTLEQVFRFCQQPPPENINLF